MDENLTFKLRNKALTDAGGRTLSPIINKFKSLKNVGYRTFESMYTSAVKPVRKILW